MFLLLSVNHCVYTDHVYFVGRHAPPAHHFTAQNATVADTINITGMYSSVHTCPIDPSYN